MSHSLVAAWMLWLGYQNILAAALLVGNPKRIQHQSWRAPWG